jgi:hypothetical protein
MPPHATICACGHHFADNSQMYVLLPESQQRASDLRLTKAGSEFRSLISDTFHKATIVIYFGMKGGAVLKAKPSKTLGRTVVGAKLLRPAIMT